MTALIPDGLEPLAVWDVRAEDWPVGRTEHMEQRLAWLNQARVGVSFCAIHRIKFYVLDGPFAAIYTYATGLEEVDPRVLEQPVIVALAELPPAHLLRG